ncbi:response regulator transcription factor [Pseudanabaena sp. FACHB-2040]|uniref:response regulator n=1 Tax=Pseudanabaena sp. FACHB-2040 TaxID=2692859 RepID=UPI001687D89C|nr:response regulator transcription factor [Pseudanabaena sp. FACHB-2040]MBD2261013.1 response regulator transcription factor [Pseudanabaena sp. FACHB-2040]
MIQLLIVDDQDTFRRNLATLLSAEEDLEVIGQARDGQEAIALSESLHPDLILMDVRMPVCDGVTATYEILQRSPWIRILVLTMFDDDEYILQSLQAGALGYLLKRTPAKQIAAAIRALDLGYCQLGPTIAPKVFARLNKSDLATVQPVTQNYSLSERDAEILALLSQGKSNREIAQTLHITEGTVKNYITRILNELGLRDRTQAALWSQQHLNQGSVAKNAANQGKCQG